MKVYLFMAFLVCGGFIASRCGVQKSAYVIGEDVPVEVRTLLIERAEKGKILYRAHCTSCHGIFQKGKDGIPDFTKQQIDSYHAAALRGLNGHGVLKKISMEQLDYIITFLRIRKVN
jgi:mono/diheme cytochrome c family protein